MKKKLISSIISVLCCLVVMAVGVYASTSKTYQLAISNDIDVKIVAVDGTLYARRIGGVWATPTESESAYGNAITNAEDFADEDKVERLKMIYDKNMNIDTEAMQSLCRKIDINVYSNEIEYVFKYVIDNGSLFITKLSIINGADGDITPNSFAKGECSYKYAYGETEPDNWNSITNVFNVDDDGQDSIEVFDEDGYRSVYIRAYLKFNTAEFGSSFSVDTAEAEKGLGFKGKWQFTLALEEGEKFCKYCGHEIVGNSNICEHCGKSQ